MWRIAVSLLGALAILSGDSFSRPRAAAQERPASKFGDKVDLTPIKKTDAEWKKQLTPEQFRVARRQGTEKAYSGIYWKEKRAGIYNCVCCDLPLFSSNHKFESGTGWPSYWQPLLDEHVKTKTDRSLGTVRVEVICTRCGAHLGHVFGDGPQPTGLRFCMNSASLKFEEKR